MEVAALDLVGGGNAEVVDFCEVGERLELVVEGRLADGCAEDLDEGVGESGVVVEVVAEAGGEGELELVLVGAGVGCAEG
jgi:hypothetical protein